MTWNYRIVKNGSSFGIYQVYYDDDLNPIGYTATAVSPYGETLDAFFSDYKRYNDGVNKPVLTINEYDKLIELDD